jgi:hypothetical protein
MATGKYATSTSGQRRFPSGATPTGGQSENEDLANFISMITRAETPFMSSIGKTKATGIYHEWQTDELNDPADSTLKQGADFDNVAPDGTDTADGGTTISNRFRTRLGNYTQINGKTVSVSGTKRAIDQTGVADEYAYQLKKRGTELRRDVERDLIHSINVSTAGTQSGAGKMGGIMSWVNNAGHIVTKGIWYAPSSGTNPGTDGAGTHAIGLDGAGDGVTTSGGAGNKAALELTDVDQAMQNVYEAGGKANRAMMSPKNRRVFSSKAQAQTQYGNVRRNIDESGSLRASVDIYMSDFGDVTIEPNYIMGLTNEVSLRNYDNSSSVVTNQDLKDCMVFIYDPSWWKLATLRPLKEVDVGQKGDSTVGMIVEECTLECSNPKGSTAIYGLNGS